MLNVFISTLGNSVKSTDLYDCLGLNNTQYSKWCKKWIMPYNGNGFVIESFIKENRGAGKFRAEYIVNIAYAIEILRSYKTQLTLDILNTLSKYVENDVITVAIKPIRHEIEFKHILEQVLEPIGISFETQKMIKNYRLDFYFPMQNILFEYDEAYHFSYTQQQMDRERENNIIKELNCKIIRLSQRESHFYNVGVVIKHILSK